MIDGLVRILLFQGVGEVVAKFVLPLVPGPVIGLMLLLLFLIAQGSVAPGLALVSENFMRYLGVLFVPAAVGVVMYWPHLVDQGLAILASLVLSVVATIAVSALLAKLLASRHSDAA
jgi:holin-like protein